MARPQLKVLYSEDTQNLNEPSKQGQTTDDRLQGSGLPDPMSVAVWRMSAEARLEGALSEYDQGLLDGLEPSVAASGPVERFMTWTRQSVRPYAGARGRTVVGQTLRTGESNHWQKLAQRSIESAATDPAGVDRFLRVWLAVVHEATATGYAALYASEPE